jgi:hypothetical protein
LQALNATGKTQQKIADRFKKSEMEVKQRDVPDWLSGVSAPGNPLKSPPPAVASMAEAGSK